VNARPHPFSPVATRRRKRRLELVALGLLLLSVGLAWPFLGNATATPRPAMTSLDRLAAEEVQALLP
jgi:hypothetical protein